MVKPAISASGYRTYSMPTAAAAQPIDEAAAHGDFLLQPFMREIQQGGEASMIYFNHEFSHAVMKRPGESEFRVQKEYGGHEVPWDPPREVIETGKSILSKVGSTVLYARVDGVISNGEFLLMELELVEPDLFLTKGDGAGERFAENLVNAWVAWSN